jgi:hypothetical protein
MAHWHSLAKLRMHHELTLDIMGSVTVSLGDKLRAFSRNTCPAFATKELRREYNARVRRGAKRSAAQSNPTVTGSAPIQERAIPPRSGLTSPQSATAQSQSSIHANVAAETNQTSHAPANPPSGKAGRLPKTFNLNTYKLHSLGDYVNAIRKYGTTDSYSTEPVRSLSILLLTIH